MITHVVMFKLNDPKDAKAVKDVLESLPPKIEVIRSYQVGIDMVRNERSWDLAVVSTFDSLEDLQTYQTHPDHVEAGGFVKARAASSAAVDYES